MNTIKTIAMVSISILFLLTSITMAQAVEYPDNPIAGCVGFDGWWLTPERTQGAIDMILWVIGEMVAMGYSDELILNISAGLWTKGPL